MQANLGLSSGASANGSTQGTDATSQSDEKLEKLTPHIDELRANIKTESVTELSAAYGSKAESSSHNSSRKRGGDGDDSDDSEP